MQQVNWKGGFRAARGRGARWLFGAGAALAVWMGPTAATGQDGNGASSPEARIEISLEDRQLWLIEAGDTVLSARVAIGRDERVVLAGREYHFRTPRGTRRVLGKERDPTWIPPDWHYLELAEALGFEAVQLERGRAVNLEDGTRLEIRGDQVGRVNQSGNFRPFDAGHEIIYYERVYIPPFGTAQREVPAALGHFKIDLGNGYLIHGTTAETRDSIGEAASHGCIRMTDEELEALYERVQPGMKVIIR